MRDALNPARLFMLFGVLGYTKMKIHSLTKWSLKAIETNIATLQMSWGGYGDDHHKLRSQFDALRKREGDEAMLKAIDRLLRTIAGPPITVKR